MPEQQRYQPSTETVRRHQPGGPFMVEHFLNYPDHRTHVERLNPLRPNESFGYSPGAQRGFQDLPLQTYNTNDTPIGAQFPAGVQPAPQPIAEEEEMTPERIAEVCHEVNRSICEAMGDHTQPAWKDATEDQRKACLTSILAVLEDPDAQPLAEMPLEQRVKDHAFRAIVKALA
jgi:hypothetical protein